MIEFALLHTLHLNPYLIERAWQEPAFEQALVSEPNATLSTALNISLPANIEYRILKDTPEIYHVVLPFIPAEASAAEVEKIYRAAIANYDPAYQEQLQDLARRAEADSAFRQRLLTEPNATLAEVLQLTIPEGFSFRVVENTQNLIHLVLPQPSIEEEEHDLVDADLTLLAGGLSSTAINCGSGDLHRRKMARC